MDYNNPILHLMKKFGVSEIEATQISRHMQGHDPDPKYGPPSDELLSKAGAVSGQYGSGRYSSAKFNQQDSEKTQRVNFDDIIDADDLVDIPGTPPDLNDDPSKPDLTVEDIVRYIEELDCE